VKKPGLKSFGFSDRVHTGDRQLLSFSDIIDISQPITDASACFPGDTPFRSSVVLSWEASQVLNLTAFAMSPHVGTHADAPSHVRGHLEKNHQAPGNPEMVGNLPLAPYLGPVWVVDVSPKIDAITLNDLASVLGPLETFDSPFPKRILFKTASTIRYEVFEPAYAYFSLELIEYLAGQGVELMGIDTPSVDPIDSKTLSGHHALLKHQMRWLENLDLTQVPHQPVASQSYFLIALPLKMTQLEASPVRAVLLVG
jgi:arylformamidase